MILRTVSRWALKLLCVGFALSGNAQVTPPATPAPAAAPAPEEITDRYKQNPEFVDIIQDPVPTSEKAAICKKYKSEISRTIQLICC